MFKSVQWSLVAQLRTASSYHQGYQALVSWCWSGQKVNLLCMLSLMTWLSIRGAIPPLSHMLSWCSAEFKHRNYSCLEFATLLHCADIFSSNTTVWTYSNSVSSKAVRSDVTVYFWTKIYIYVYYNWHHAIHVRCFPCYNGMTILLVAQGDGLRIRMWLWVCRLNSCIEPIRGGPSEIGLGREKIIPDCTKYTNLNDKLNSSPHTISVAK